MILIFPANYNIRWNNFTAWEMQLIGQFENDRDITNSSPDPCADSERRPPGLKINDPDTLEQAVTLP